MLYKGSLRNNLDLIGQYTDAEIWSALEKVCMKNKFQFTGLETEVKKTPIEIILKIIFRLKKEEKI